MRSEDAPTEPMDAPLPSVECAICRAERGESVTFPLYDTGAMRQHLRDEHAPGFVLAVQFPDPGDEQQTPSFDFGD